MRGCRESVNMISLTRSKLQERRQFNLSRTDPLSGSETTAEVPLMWHVYVTVENLSISDQSGGSREVLLPGCNNSPSHGNLFVCVCVSCATARSDALLIFLYEQLLALMKLGPMRRASSNRDRPHSS